MSGTPKDRANSFRIGLRRSSSRAPPSCQQLPHYSILGQERFCLLAGCTFQITPEARLLRASLSLHLQPAFRRSQAKFCTFRYNGTCLLGNGCFLSHSTTQKGGADAVMLCLDVIEKSTCNPEVLKVWPYDRLTVCLAVFIFPMGNLQS